MASLDPALKRDRPTLVDHDEVDTLMRRFFEQSRGRPAPAAVLDAVPAEPGAAPPRRDFDMASDLLDRASQAFDLLITRCQTLEHDLSEAAERTKAQAVEQQDVIEQWKRLSSGLKTQIEAFEDTETAMKQRCNAAEARAAMAEQRAAALERASLQAANHAALAESLSTKLHDKVVTAFGIGSRAHPVLEAVATRTAID